MRWDQAGEFLIALLAAVALGLGLRRVFDPDEFEGFFMAYGSKHQKKQQEEAHHWEARLTAHERALVCDALRAFRTDLSALRTAALTQVQLARRMPGPKRDLIDWEVGEKELEKRGELWTWADLAEEGK